MKTRIFEHTSFDTLNAEGRGRSRMLPVILAFEKMMGKDRKITISLKNSRDYYTLWQQLIAAGNKISLKDPRNGQEIGPQKFAKSLELLGLEDPTDLQDFIEDYTYRKMLEDAGVKFSFSKEVRNAVINPGKVAIVNNGKLSEIGITDEEGIAWEWGTDEDSDKLKQAPEGRLVWVIRAHEYPEYPCMFVYPLAQYDDNGQVCGPLISKYSTALDIFFMNKSKDNGVIYNFYDAKNFNLMWVACPCTYRHFLKYPIPTDAELAKAKERRAAEREIEETDIKNYKSEDVDESLVADREALKRLVESYGKKDVVNFVRHLNESAGYQYTFNGYIIDPELWDLVNNNGHNIVCDWYDDDHEEGFDSEDTQNEIAKILEKKIAPNKIKVSIGYTGYWREELQNSEPMYQIDIEFNNDLTKQEALFIFNNLTMLDSTDKEKISKGLFSLSNLSKLRYVDGNPDWPAYDGDYIALAKLAGIKGSIANNKIDCANFEEDDYRNMTLGQLINYMQHDKDGCILNEISLVEAKNSLYQYCNAVPNLYSQVVLGSRLNICNTILMGSDPAYTYPIKWWVYYHWAELKSRVINEEDKNRNEYEINVAYNEKEDILVYICERKFEHKRTPLVLIGLKSDPEIYNPKRYKKYTKDDSVKIYMSVPIDDWVDDINRRRDNAIDENDSYNGFVKYLKDNYNIIAKDAFNEVGGHEEGADSMSFLIPLNVFSVDFFIELFGAKEFKRGIEAYIADDDYYADEGPVGILEPTDKNELKKLLKFL